MKGGEGSSWREREPVGREERKNEFAEGYTKLFSGNAKSVLAVSICVNLD